MIAKLNHEPAEGRRHDHGGPVLPRPGWRPHGVFWAWLFVALVLSGCATNQHQNPDPGETPDLAPTVDTFALLCRAADHEALFTLAGGLKPMSTGIWRGTFSVDEPELAELRSVRAALAPLRNDLWYADVQVFKKVHNGKRTAHAYVIHRAAMTRTIERFEEFWSQWGITPCTHPSEVVAVVDRMPKAARWRGYGHLFGYPPHAVDFFVQAGLARDDGRAVGPGKDRQFIQIPTHAAKVGRFTYAVPLDHVRNAADDALADTAARILSAYTERKERMKDARRMIAELRRLNHRFDISPVSMPSAGSSQLESGAPMNQLRYKAKLIPLRPHRELARWCRVMPEEQ